LEAEALELQGDWGKAVTQYRKVLSAVLQKTLDRV
jgi:hypothetical protein